MSDFSTRIFRVLSLCGIYFFPLFICLRPVGTPGYDPDLWWHLAVGRWVVENQTVPTTDPFTQLHPPWVAYSWLYEILLYGMYDTFGLTGIVVYRTVMAMAVTATVHWLVCLLSPHALTRSALTLLATFCMASMYSERPWMFTLVIGALTLCAIVRLRQGPSVWVWLLPLAYVFWANIHIQFIYGLFLLFLACVLPQAVPLPRPAYRQLLWVAAACVLATLMNPYGIQVYFVVVELATQPGPFSYIPELHARDFRVGSDWALLAGTAAAVFALGRRGPTLFESVFLVAAAWFAFRANRDGWFLVLANLLILAPALRLGETNYPRDWVVPIVTGCLLVGLFLLLLRRYDLSEAGLERTAATVFPVQACRVIEERNLPGPIFNDFDWGGYVIFALPERPASLDGRTNLHGDERIFRFAKVWAGHPIWQKDPDLATASVVLAPAVSPLGQLLRLDPRWRVAHEDEVATVFVRR